MIECPTPMPMHDWTSVEAWIFHDFHHEWISEIKRALNRGLLPPDHYAMAEQVAAGFGPGALSCGLHHRRKSLIAIRQVSGDRIVAVIEIVSPFKLVSFQSDMATRPHIEALAVGKALPAMALVLAPSHHITIPLEATYQAAWETVPARWQRVIDAVR